MRGHRRLELAVTVENDKDLFERCSGMGHGGSALQASQ